MYARPGFVIAILMMASCMEFGPRVPLDPARFAPKATWSYALPAKLPPSVAVPTEDQMIEDVAYLQHAINEAWAWSSRSTLDSFNALPERLRNVPIDSRRDAQVLCATLAQELRNTGIHLELGGQPCHAIHVPKPVGALDSVPAGRNYQLRLDQAADHVVGILTISRFADPADAGWQGFRAAMKQLATLDLVIIDVQNAQGDDPRAGFAILAALGLENYDRAYLQPASFKDGAIAKVARRNAQALTLKPPAPRSRTLWSSFRTGADIRRIAREVVPGLSRKKPVVSGWFFVGPMCGRACQLMIRLVQWGAFSRHGTFEDQSSGDEHGVIRLPHSGITATFPTAAYGPYTFGGYEHLHATTADVVKTELAALHDIGHKRATALAWSTRKLPNCAKLPIDPALLSRKGSGCRDHTSLAPSENVTLTLQVDAATAKRFLDTCTGLVVGHGMDTSIAGASTVSVSGTRDALLQALAAPFVTGADWGCDHLVHPH